MKKHILLSGMVLLAATATQAALYTYSWSSGFDAGSGAIPDANPTGWSDTRQISDITGDDTIVDVNVKLNITGGFNGDLYGYLVHSSGFAVLLNRVGRGTGTEPVNSHGYADAGFNITLGVNGGADIHSYGGNGGSQLVGGSWIEDGRNANPLAVMDADTRTALLSSFNSLAANGDWTLFLSDMAGGDTSTVVSWGLDIQVVPEPTTWALLIFAGLGGGAGLGHWLKRFQRNGARTRP